MVAQERLNLLDDHAVIELTGLIAFQNLSSISKGGNQKTGSV